jgi:hypothetical protein
MADSLIIPLGEIFHPNENRPVQGGGSRMVPLVDTNSIYGKCPCIWRSTEPVMASLKENSSPELAYECLLLISRDPPQTLHAQIEAAAFKIFPQIPVEW